MNKQEKLSRAWKKFKLSCRFSISPDYAKKFCKELNIVWDKKLIYTALRYREQSENRPRVDCEDLLYYAVKQLNGITPNKKLLELSKKMSGEGRRRQCIEDAYILEE